MQKGETFELNQMNVIGEGRFGRVYRAFSKKFNTEFALKEISKGKLTNDDMFINEVRILSSFIHPNIIKLYGYYSNLDSYKFVLQYCSKGTLKTEIKKNGCLNTEKFSIIFKQILEAISYSHKKKIAHRDLKPDNVLFDEYNRIQIADWGQAIFVDNEEGIVDSYCGTLSYASPQCISKHPYNAYKNDIYSIGVIMYFSVCGHDPWTEKVPICKKDQIINNKYRLLPSSIDKDVSNLIYLLLDYDQYKRPDAEELLKLPIFQKKSLEMNYKSTRYSKKRYIGNILTNSLTL